MSNLPAMAPTAALLTDLYELTMAAAYVAEGLAEVAATFSLFVRELPTTRGYLVAGGLADCVEYLETWRFTGTDIDALRRAHDLPDQLLDWLSGARFDGAVRAVPEGTIVFAEEPILEVDASLAVAQLVETYLLNRVTLHTTLLTKAARVRHAAAEHVLVDFGLRRAPGVDAGMALARACAITGFTATSNVAAGVELGLDLSGTMAHSYVSAHASELDAFRSFARVHGDATVLLVDTYDTIAGIDAAITVAREMPGSVRAIRLDSGDLAHLARVARARLDDAGCAGVGVFVSGNLDEYTIDDLVRAGAPIDGFGVGSRLADPDDAPSLDTVYKLVDVGGRAVVKRSPGKATRPGRKQVWRRDGFAGDVIGPAGAAGPPRATALLTSAVEGGQRVAEFPGSLGAARDRFAAEFAALPEPVKRLRNADRYPVEIAAELTAVQGRGG